MFFENMVKSSNKKRETFILFLKYMYLHKHKKLLRLLSG